MAENRANDAGAAAGQAAAEDGLPPDFDVDVYIRHPANPDLRGIPPVPARHH